MTRRRLLTGVAIVCFCFAVVSVRALWEGYGALDRGNQAFQEGRHEDAIRWWRRSARWYVPLGPHVGRAYEKLQKLATASEEAGDTKLALAAYRGIRSSIRATRSIYSPYDHLADEADQHIATLMAEQEEGVESSTERAELREWHYELLKRDAMPSTFWSIIAILGLALWIGSGFGFALRAVNEQDQLHRKAAAYSGAGIALGLVIWLVGLALA